MFDIAGKRVWVCGHRGMVGSALVRRLADERCEILTASRSVLDLTDRAAVRRWARQNKPDAVFVAAARVGGILANSTEPVPFLRDNLLIGSNVIEASAEVGVKKLVYLGSSCIYPREAAQPMHEDSLLAGPLEPTNQWYAIAKIAGIKLCEAYRQQYGHDFVSAMPTNLYGPGDNYDLGTSHVLPALIAKFHDAKVNRRPKVVLWGTGAPLREFMHVDDCADALVFVLRHYSEDQHINIGSGEEISIRELAGLVGEVVGYDGEIVHDLDKPDGMPRKLMESSRLTALGWSARIGLGDGIAAVYRDYVRECRLEASA